MMFFHKSNPGSSILGSSILGSSISICLLLAGCGSGSKSTSGGGTPPPPSSFQLTIAAPTANAGVVTSTPAGIECSGNGGDASNVCSAAFASGTKVTLVATAAIGYSFSGWSGGGCSGTSSCVVTMTSATTVTPAFLQTASASLSVSYLPSGVPSSAGTVVSNPSGISCPGTCTASFANNTQVVLTAAAGSGYTFSGWSGGSCSGTSTCAVIVTSAVTVSPTFTSTSTSATLTLSLAGSGTVTSSPSGINCPLTCSTSFPLNTSITLTETASANNGFIGWGGLCFGSGSCTVSLTSAGTVSASFAPNSGSLQSLNHIIIFAQENRSLDHYFGAMRHYWAKPGSGFADQQFDGLPQFNPQSGNIPPAYGPPPAVPGCDPNLSTATTCQASFSAPLVTSFHNVYSVCSEALSPFWNEAHIDWDFNNPIGTTAPQLNGWVQAAANDARQVTPQLHDVNGYRTMGYYDDTDLNYYYYMASTFATSDRWFAPTMSRTQLNRMFLLSGTSGGHVYPLAPPYGALTNMPIFQALQNAGISWKIYVNSTGTNCSDTDSKCLIQHSYINMFTYYSTVANNPLLLQNIASVTQLKTDLANGTLPQVALIEPPSDAGLDEHPTDSDAAGGIDIQSGAAFTASIMNALMASPNWKDSAMFFTYDEPGGFYDHVPPQATTPPDSSSSPNYLPIDLKPGDICSNSGELGSGICNFGYTGYRLPFILVSPFAKKNYVSHTPYDHTAILKLIEKRFNLSPLSNRDAAQADMSLDFFDFVNAPWATPPSNVPAQFRGGACNLNALPAPPPNP